MNISNATLYQKDGRRKVKGCLICKKKSHFVFLAKDDICSDCKRLPEYQDYLDFEEKALKLKKELINLL